MASQPIPTLRWGIIATGMISSWFVEDLVLLRKDPKAKHIIQAVGSSSLEKGNAFVQKHAPTSSPSVYSSYEQVYADPNVDIVYIGTPHAYHKQNCLDAIAAGKHVLCEKAFTITAKEAKEVLAAAQANGVFIMEAMWLRFNPLVLALQEKLHKQKIIGDVMRTFCDFSLDMNVAALGSESRLRNPRLGAGSLLDIGIYSLTWGLLTLDPKLGDRADKPQVRAAQSLFDKIDVNTSILLKYPSGQQGVLTSSTQTKTDEVFARIEGTRGSITVSGMGASVPSFFTVYAKDAADGGKHDSNKGDVFKFENVGRGFFHEADAVALDIAANRKENSIMPHAETVRVMEVLDEVRRQGGARFPQDDE